MASGKPSALHTVCKRGFIFLLLLALYLVTSVPVGLFLYSLKSNAGINVFSKTGFHSYMHCLQEQAYLIEIKNSQEKKTEKARNSDQTGKS